MIQQTVEIRYWPQLIKLIQQGSGPHYALYAPRPNISIHTGTVISTWESGGPQFVCYTDEDLVVARLAHGSGIQAILTPAQLLEELRVAWQTVFKGVPLDEIEYNENKDPLKLVAQVILTIGGGRRHRQPKIS